MTRPHPPSGTEVAVTALAAATTYLTLLSWKVLSTDSAAYLVPLFWFVVLIGALGLGLRTLRTPWPLVPVVQLGVVALTLHGWWTAGSPLALRIPTSESVGEMVTMVHRAALVSGSYPAPVPGNAVDFPPILIAVGLVVALLVDILACTLRRIPLAGLPLLAAFTVPVSIVGGVSWITFVLAATAFVFLLTADQAARLGTWGRNVAGGAGEVTDDQPHEVRLGTLWPTASRMGLAGVGLAVLVPVLLPSGGGLLDRGNGGNGPGGDDVSITNPLVDMKRDLIRDADVPLIRVTTDDPSPGYLRTAVLDKFDGTAWRASERDIPEANRASAGLPLPPGLSADTPRQPYDYTVSITDAFHSTWLPTPYPVTQVRAAGDWRYDDDTLDLAAVGDETHVEGLNYDVAGLDVTPDPVALVDADLPPRKVALDGTALPSTMPPWVAERAAEVTANAHSPFERAVMLQDWFRKDGGFTYSLDRASGSGLRQLELFLGTGDGSRTGYCEQFASAMAMMARTLGIPARVAVGFLRPTAVGDGTWIYSSHDLHSWPELYFEGAGWIRFEPTPQARTANAVPAYTVGRVPQPDLGPAPTAAADPEAIRPSRVPAERSTTTTSTVQGTSSSRWSDVVRVVGVAALVAVLLLAPWALRVLARRRRFAHRDPQQIAEGAWAEVRATALDLGRGWSDGVTLRRQAQRLAPAMGPTPLDPLESLVLLVERSRYSRLGLGPVELAAVRELSETVTSRMLAQASPKARRRATWLPRSLVRAGFQDGLRRTGLWGLGRRRPATGARATGESRAELEQVSL